VRSAARTRDRRRVPETTITNGEVPETGALSLLVAGPKAEQLRDSAAARLERDGVTAEVIVEAAPARPALLLFDAATPTLLAALHQMAQTGVECLLAIACDPGALAGGVAWSLVQAGASDAFAYHDSPEFSARVAARVERWREVDAIMASRAVRSRLVGCAAEWRAAVTEAVEAARFNDAPVVLTGETGTGKELVARLIHELDPRPRKDELVLVDCTTIVPTLSGSEFFGHERGAFTGATAARDGAFALADGGTLFLDEVGELPATLQAELLRVVQEGVYKRVGGNDWHTTSFRLVCATNRDLFTEAQESRFRPDLLYRLAGTTIRLPSLRERREDIVPLAEHFVRELCGRDAPEVDEDVRSYLRTRDYPGNVRELRQLIARIACRHVGPGPITVGDVPPDERRPVTVSRASAIDESFAEAIRFALGRGMTLREIGAAAAEAAIRVALADEGENVSRAARRLGVTPRALQLRRANGKQPEGVSAEH
jgi:transcriptional regulator with GAF, ATPase, and Fis domain